MANSDMALEEDILVSHFEQDILEGLSAPSKWLSSRYFYDAIGDKLFQEIMSLDEYYPTRTEHTIFQDSKQSILDVFGNNFRLIELGAGDGYKTKVLLQHFVARNTQFTYSPVDISEDILQELKNSCISEIPELDVDPLPGDYFKVMEETVKHDHKRNVILFLGSNIGNYSAGLRSDFLRQLRGNLKKGDMVLIGFDMKKDPDIIIGAYFDKKGVTTAFNKNLLSRINRELDGTFDLDTFKHFPYYDPTSGECRSYLISQVEQDVHVAGEVIHFDRWEPIFMEVSKKFDLKEIEGLASTHGFKIVENFTDSKGWFVDAVWEAI